MYNRFMKRNFSDKLIYKNPKTTVLVILFELFWVGVYLAVDLLTKHFIYMPIAAGAEDITIWKGVLKLVAVENTGASFGIFQNANEVLSIFSIVVVVFLLVFLIFSVKERNGWLRAALILMIAGGIGNLVDRFMFGYVRDWIYFELIDFAVFNLADSGLTVGCVLLIIFVIFIYRPEDKKKKSDRIDVDSEQK